jgi:hypothetical protein
MPTIVNGILNRARMTNLPVPTTIPERRLFDLLAGLKQLYLFVPAAMHKSIA